MKKTFLLSLLILCTAFAFGQWQIDEDFEGITTLPTGWTVYDDGDGMTWRNLEEASHAHSGTRFAFADNYFPNQNCDWMITPQLAITSGDSLLFYTRAWYGTENLKVYVSTTGNAISNFSTQILNLQNLGTTFQYASYNLSAYAGQNIYIGFKWECETYGIVVDDVKIGQPVIVTPELNLPDSYTFWQGETLTVDFTPYIVATDINNVQLSWQTPEHITISATGLSVTFSSDNWNGTENITFTLTDNINGVTASDTVQIIVHPIPTVDMALQTINSPSNTEYVNSLFTPTVIVKNNGQVLWEDQLEISFKVYNSQNSLVDSISAYFNPVLEPEATYEVIFPVMSINTEGVYTATFQINLSDNNPTNDIISREFNVILRINTGGPDAFGFRYIDNTAENGPTFDWIDISSTGTSTIMYGVNQFNGDDNFSEPIPFGFDFPFYGVNYSTAYVDINGEILLADNNWYKEYPDSGWGNDGNMFNYMYPIPGYNQMPGLIAVYWDDLHCDQGTGDIYFQSLGEEPNRYCVIQWHNVRFHAGTGISSYLDFEVILHENGEIVMQYNSTATGQTGANVPHDNGKSATVALQSSDATMGICYLREIVQNNAYQGVEPAGNLLFDGLAIRFYSGEDTQAPFITHTAPGNTFNQSPVLEARVIDLSELANVTLHYNYGEGWDTLEGIATGNGYYTFILPQLPTGHTFSYYIASADANENSSTLPAGAPDEVFQFKILPTDGTEVLLAYSGKQDYQHTELPVYVERLENLNISYDLYNWEEYEEYSIPDTYSTIITYACTGSASPATLYFSQKLMDFLNSGTIDNAKNLFFASDGFAFSQAGTPNSHPMKQLLNGYLRTHSVATGSGGGTNGLAGPDVFSYQTGTIISTNSSPIGNAGTEYSVYANSPDCISAYESVPDWYVDLVPYPEIGAVNAFAFEDGPVDGHAYLYHGVCATAVDTPIFKTFYFSFDYSQLNNPAQSEELFSDLMEWFGIGPDAVDDVETPVVKSELKANYPNPFNPTTTIVFSLATAEKVEINIYNLKGQKVKTLLSDNLLSGNHSVVWDGKNDKNNSVSSGIYLVKMQTGKTTATRKITMLK
jgi:hypothetical protein